MKLFDFSVEVTFEQYEKMNKTIQDLNNAANIMRLKLAAPILSPTPSAGFGGGGVSISGRVALKRAEVMQKFDDTVDECSIPEEGQPSDYPPPPLLDNLSSSVGEKSPTHHETEYLTSSSTKSTSHSAKGSRDLDDSEAPSLVGKYPHPIDEHDELILETSLDDRKVPGRLYKRKSSIQIAVEIALGVLVKYFPAPSTQSTKIHVTTENLD